MLFLPLGLMCVSPLTLNTSTSAGARPPLTVVLVNNGGGGIFSFLPAAEQIPEDAFTELWATPQHVDLMGARPRQDNLPPQSSFVHCFFCFTCTWHLHRRRYMPSLASPGRRAAHASTPCFHSTCRQPSFNPQATLPIAATQVLPLFPWPPGMCRAHGIAHQAVRSTSELPRALESAWRLNRHSVVEVCDSIYMFKSVALVHPVS